MNNFEKLKAAVHACKTIPRAIVQQNVTNTHDGCVTRGHAYFVITSVAALKDFHLRDDDL